MSNAPNTTPAPTSPDTDLEGLNVPDSTDVPERDVEGLGPAGDVDSLDSTHRAIDDSIVNTSLVGLDRRADDDGLDLAGARETEDDDSLLGQDPGESDVNEPDVPTDSTMSDDGADVRSR